MEKTKLGIPVGIMIAATYFLGLYGGYVITGILVGYILLKEEDDFLRKQAAGVLGLMILFSLISSVLNLVPNMLSLYYNVADSYYYSETYSDINKFFNTLGGVVSLVKTVAFALFGILAALNKPVKIPVVSKFVDTFLN